MADYWLSDDQILDYCIILIYLFLANNLLLFLKKTPHNFELEVDPD